MGRSFTDLYCHGEHMNWLCKSFYKKFKHAEESDDKEWMLAWGEAFRKVTNDTVAIARVVLRVEEIVKGKNIQQWRET